MESPSNVVGRLAANGAGAISRQTLQPGTRPNRLLLAGLLAVYALVALKSLFDTVLLPGEAGNDLEISLRAGERWLAGVQPYLPTFDSGPGPDSPFLYPPYTLPVIAILTSVPRVLLVPIWIAVMLMASIFAARRLRIPWEWLPLVLIWPPFAEGIVVANVQVLLFAAFVVMFFVAVGDRWSPTERDIAEPRESGVLIGGLATIVGAIKVSQPHPWLYALRHRPRAALGGAIVAVMIVGLTLPLTGVELWFDWLGQLQRASDPDWHYGGFALSRFLPAPQLGLLVAAATVVGVWFVPRARAGAVIGVLSVIGALSLHTFGLLFLVPAMLYIRKELALISAICIATYSYEGMWAGIILVSVGTLYASRDATGRAKEAAVASTGIAPTADSR
jgi:hypothetical protein